jgi:uncharacterized protein (TIGR02217 family)
MTGFHDVRFPLPLAFGASGGPMRRTDITPLASGAEHRNTPHAQSRRRYNAGAGVKSIDQLAELISFFEARFGQLHGFRFRDPLDYKSCKPSENISSTDQIIGGGDGETRKYSLSKNYSDEVSNYERRITKPLPQSAKIALNGIEVPSSEFDLNGQTGDVVFAVAPPPESIITAGFEFDVPVRFDTDQLDVSLEAFGAGQVINIPLIEILDHA